MIVDVPYLPMFPPTCGTFKIIPNERALRHVPRGMGDLQVSGAVLDELRAALRSITGKLEGACRELRGVQADGMGAQPLVSGVQDFTSEWNYGITQVGQHTSQAVGMLDHVASAFDGLERQLTAELKGSGKQ